MTVFYVLPRWLLKLHNLSHSKLQVHFSYCIREMYTVWTYFHNYIVLMVLKIQQYSVSQQSHVTYNYYKPHPSCCPFFHSIFRTDWPLTLNFCVCVGHDRSSQGIEAKVMCQDQGHRSGLCGRSDLDWGQFFLLWTYTAYHYIQKNLLYSFPVYVHS